MEKEFNLSKKIETNAEFNRKHSLDTIRVSNFIWKSDVKEFIRLLKEDLFHLTPQTHAFSNEEIHNVIDTRAGEELSSVKDTNDENGR